MSIGTPSVGTLTERTAETTSPVPYPPVTNLNDIILLMGSTRATGVNITAPSAPWAQVDQHSPNADTANGDTGMWWRLSAGTEAGGSLNVSHTSQASIWQMYSISGVDPVTPFDTTPTFTSSDPASSATPQLGGLTVVTAGAMFVVVGTINSTAGNAVAVPDGPGSFTETGQRSTGTATSEFAYLANLPVGATGNVTFHWSGAVRSYSIGVVLRPLVAPAMTFTKTVTVG